MNNLEGRHREILALSLQGHTATEISAQLGCTERTVKRAKEDLEIVSRTVYLDGKRTSYWLLPSQELPAHIPPEAVEFDLSALLGRQGQSEKRNPLDSM